MRINNAPRPAFQAYARLTGAEREACAAVFERCAQMITASTPDERYRPMLSTWLANRGWEADGLQRASTETTSLDWRKRIAHYQRGGEWLSVWGPPPGDPRCQAPADLTGTS